jgi:transcriptional regulator with XRE-family HTH domain
MPVTYEELLAKLPAAEREEITAGAARLIREEATLRELREVRARSQEQIAERLQVGQGAVSKLERRADMYISTLRRLIQAMGGDLEIVATFPDHPPVRITQFRGGLKGEALVEK